MKTDEERELYELRFRIRIAAAQLLAGLQDPSFAEPHRIDVARQACEALETLAEELGS